MDFLVSEFLDFWILPNARPLQVFVRLPAGTSGKAVFVDLQTNLLTVTVEGQEYLKGELYAPIKQDMSVWVICEHSPSPSKPHICVHNICT
jgi:CHAD domain-containing protein